MMTDEELLSAADLGLIPSVNEGEEDFRERVEFALNLKKTLQKNQHETIRTPAEFSSSCEVTRHLFKISPDWVPVIVSNEKLLPWQGGAALIFELEEGSPRSALIQMRNKIYSFYVNRRELLAHEIVHVARMGFNEPQFEEMMAYKTSESKIYREYGPLFSTNFDTLFFTSLLILVATVDSALVMTGSLQWYDHFMVLKILPGLYLLYLFFKLYRSHKIFNVVEKKMGLPAMLCLTDSEIKKFSKMSLVEIQKSLGKSLRERLALIRLKNS